MFSPATTDLSLARSLARARARSLSHSHSHTPLTHLPTYTGAGVCEHHGGVSMDPPGTHFTCFTSTQVQILIRLQRGFLWIRQVLALLALLTLLVHKYK